MAAVGSLGCGGRRGPLVELCVALVPAARRGPASLGIRDVPKRRHTSASTALHCGHRGSRERKGCAAIGFDASLDAAITWRTSRDDLKALSPLQALGFEIAV